MLSRNYIIKYILLLHVFVKLKISDISEDGGHGKVGASERGHGLKKVGNTVLDTLADLRQTWWV